MIGRLTVGVILIVAAGCASHNAATDVTHSIGSTAVSFSSSSSNIRFSYPATWHPVKDDTVLTLVPAGEEAIGLRVLAIDEPDLPLHIPGLIPMPAVESGFVDDLKKRYKQVEVASAVERAVDGVAARELHALGQRDAGLVAVWALLCVRGDHVYVITATTDPSGEAAAKAAFDMVVGSIRWIE
jgi:PsbP-like protein